MGAPALTVHNDLPAVTAAQAAALARIRTSESARAAIREARRVIGLTASELGVLVGVHGSTVANLETGRAQIGNRRAAAILTAILEMHPNAPAVVEAIGWPVEYEPAQAELLPIREDVDPFAPSSLALAAYKAVEAMEELAAGVQRHARAGLIQASVVSDELLRIAETLKETA
jgi:transcriptional regulator with XRE-family HTH domain